MILTADSTPLSDLTVTKLTPHSAGVGSFLIEGVFQGYSFSGEFSTFLEEDGTIWGAGWEFLYWDGDRKIFDGSTVTEKRKTLRGILTEWIIKRLYGKRYPSDNPRSARHPLKMSPTYWLDLINGVQP